MSKRLTKIRKIIKKRPKTVKQKYERLKSINPEIENLVDTFGLDLSL